MLSYFSSYTVVFNSHLFVYATMYVTDGLFMNGATSVPKAVLRLVLDKDLTTIWNLNFFSDF